MRIGIFERLLGLALWVTAIVGTLNLLLDLYVDDVGDVWPRIGLVAIAALALEYRHNWLTLREGR